jgi:hypothetical protein
LFGLRQIYREGFRYAKAGVLFHELQSASIEQGELFGRDASRQARMMVALDAINDKYGRGALKSRCGRAAPNVAYESRQAQSRLHDRLGGAPDRAIGPLDEDGVITSPTGG